jgi:nucleoside-diphosphate-sugar epimerase
MVEIPTNAKSTALITGGSGFIGTHLARHLLQLGWEVTTLDLLPPREQLNSSHQIWDIRNRLPKDLVAPPDIIFNLAAIHRTPGHPDSQYFETNVLGALNICDWAELSGTKTICFMSSISIYGPGEELKSEATAPAPISPYGISKYMAERIHTRWAQQDKSRILKIIRPAVVFGQGEQGNFTRLAHALSQNRFFYPGRDDTLKACGYIRDLVRALCFTLDTSKSISTFNYCYPKPYTIRDVCEAFQQVAGYQSPRMIPRSLIQVPLKVIDLINIEALSRQAQRIQKLENSTNIEPAALIEAGFVWETNLVSGIAEWFDACGRDRFV